MKTVEQIIEELKQFPLDAKCFAYEGESIGISILKDGNSGFIHCSEQEEDESEIKPELFGSRQW
jgi:hypothetical protein